MATPNRYEGPINHRMLMRVMEDINNISNVDTRPIVVDEYMYVFDTKTWTYSIEKRTSPKARERKVLKDFL